MKVLVTGGHGGIGSSIVARYVNAGHRVWSPDSSELDLSNEQSIDSYLAEEGQFEVLISCAGINNTTPFLELSDEELSETLQVNLLANYKLTKKILPFMVSQRFGRIVNISSLWSFLTVPGRTSYSISKAGLDALTRSLSVEFGEFGVLINSVLPGFVDTALTRKNLSDQRIMEVCEKTPTKALVQEEDLASIVYYLGSEENGAVTGQSIVVDGGYSILGF